MKYLLIFVFVYLCIAFGNLELNCLLWSRQERVALISVSPALCLLYTMFKKEE